MPQLELTLETVTPLFLAGADARGTPELRPPAFRGAMRYWLRAALGGVIGDDDVALGHIKKLEGAVFGSADEKAASASGVIVRRGSEEFETLSYSDMTGYDKKTGSYRLPGLAYLLFAAREGGGEPERIGLFGTFDVSLSARPGNMQSQRNLLYAYASFWLLTHMGAIGSRSRRGAGAIQITRVSHSLTSVSDLELIVKATSPRELATELQGGLRSIRTLLGKPAYAETVKAPSAFDILHPGCCKIWVIDQDFSEWHVALDKVGQAYQHFRQRDPRDYQIIKGTVTERGTLSQPIERAAFGLPIVFFYSSLYREYQQQGDDKRMARKKATGTLEGQKNDRRASPLWIRPVKLANNSYAVVLVWFQSAFLEPQESLILKKFKGQSLGRVPNGEHVRRFVEGSDTTRKKSLKDQGFQVIEVSYV